MHMNKILLLFFLLTFSYSLEAQNIGCDDGNRYINDLFTDIKVTSDLKFGEGTTIFGNDQELFLDVYEPEGDDLEERPVIILAFGGSFISGSKEDVAFLCEAYARKGYVAVAIDYRLYDGPLLPLPTDTQMKEVVVKTVSDIKAAVRYMRQDADTDNLFRIDPSKVIIGGISAGAIATFHAAALDEEDDLPDDIRMFLEENGGIEGNTSENYQYSSEVQGLVNFSGGLNVASWIDAEDPPFVSIHDDMDGVVPYGGGFARVFGFPIIFMEGSQRCTEVADSVGVVNALRTIENSDGHVSYFSTFEQAASSVNFTTDFLIEIICGELATNTEEIQAEPLAIYPNPTTGLLTLEKKSNQVLDAELFDMMGRRLEVYKNISSLDLTAYPGGMYIIRITDQNSDAVFSERIILER